MKKNLLMKTTPLLVTVFVSLLHLCSAKVTVDQSELTKKPNFIILFVDDLGWADLEHRNPIFHTPNVSRLKDEGMEFSRAYISTATCSPSRASLLLGKESARIQLVRHITHENEMGTNSKEFNLWETDPAQMPSRNWLPLEETTYAERLKDFGYYSTFIGKWHLGHEPYHPIHQGFDVQYGTGNHGHPDNYYSPSFKHGNPLADIPDGKYLTDTLTDNAVHFIESYDRDQPFMLNLWYYNVHSPFIGRNDLVEKYEKQGLEGKYAEYAAMISAMDESVGRVMDALEKKGIADETVVIFLSDQGGYFSNAPLRGGKIGGQTICEGGSRVPMIIKYPGIANAGAVCDTPVQSIDVYPTLLELASGKRILDPGVTGKSLVPLLTGGEIEPRNLYFYRSYEDQYTAVISGDWKLIKYRSGKFELFDLKNDIGESLNLVEEEPGLFEKMKTDLNHWERVAVPVF